MMMMTWLGAGILRVLRPQLPDFPLEASMRYIQFSVSCLLLLSAASGCGDDDDRTKKRDAAADASGGDANVRSDDLGVHDGSACEGDSCSPICVSAPGPDPAPTFACDAEHEGDVECGIGGCGYICASSCWNPLCDGPCGGLDLGT